MLSGHCNHRELELKESGTGTANLCREKGCQSYRFVVKKYDLISENPKNTVAQGKGGVSTIEKRCNALCQ